ncbi:MAG TPA: type II toxin-antitoxin system VapC family toxin [Mycobacteriales bacterium]|nr:type II toxin-antitoxin system VapC family toxin [Mycobacteriales bacterium]
MSVLLDTHVLLWWLEDDKRLSLPARDAILAAEEVRVSAASVWEIAIKRALGRLDVPADYLDYVEQTSFRPLPITFQHADLAGALPRHHDDPFDRMLVAQARIEGLTLVTADRRLGDYGIALLSAV